VISADRAYAADFSWVLDVVTADRALTEYDSAGHQQQLVPPGEAFSAAVAFNKAGAKVRDVIFSDLSLWQFDSTGAHKLLQL
jgi:hypothetical protein